MKVQSFKFLKPFKILQIFSKFLRFQGGRMGPGKRSISKFFKIEIQDLEFFKTSLI